MGLLIRAVMVMSLLMAVFFLPAGTFNWPEAWLVLSVYLALSLAAFGWMKRHDPELLAERTSRGAKEKSKPWDNRLMLVYSILMLILIAVCGLDRVRFGWSHVPLAVKLVAFALFAFPGMIFFQVIRENHFLSERVRIQHDRGHQVCSSGPYRVVRHPMYVAIIAFVFLLPPALGSFFGLIAAVPVGMLMVLRTHLEDRTLIQELPGYGEYAARVRHRLIPGLW